MPVKCYVINFDKTGIWNPTLKSYFSSAHHSRVLLGMIIEVCEQVKVDILYHLALNFKNAVFTLFACFYKIMINICITENYISSNIKTVTKEKVPCLPKSAI